ncbi:hypothetical protein OGAPHI_003651 [Ogataea philodendri]|uniref:Coatomer subunit zeta n=1 Tax=Ogataea philodendri TaxID=1378263 RepID=A0A9P8P570_9ASCO|nr:uncharacterized protein OGAPHI_003651 [Ogataea philodendri]KAH3665467.1 hypothetical protein OGAPHI_003651 [Ogataea philodendri]
MPFDVSLYSVQATIILDNEGKRLFAKYYHPPHKVSDDELITSEKKQASFEASLFKKTFKLSSDIILFENKVVVYREFADAAVYLLGDLNENENLLYNVLQGLVGALEIILRNQIDKKSILENYDMVILAIDETVDDGIVLETDPSVIASRVSKPPTEDNTNIKIDLSEKGLLSAFNFARKNISDRLQQGF